jgi:hypothetical protein
MSPGVARTALFRWCTILFEWRTSPDVAHKAIFQRFTPLISCMGVSFSWMHATLSAVHAAFSAMHATFSAVLDAFSVMHATFSAVHAASSVMHGAFSAVRGTFSVVHATLGRSQAQERLPPQVSLLARHRRCRWLSSPAQPRSVRLEKGARVKFPVAGLERVNQVDGKFTPAPFFPVRLGQRLATRG